MSLRTVLDQLREEKERVNSIISLLEELETSRRLLRDAYQILEVVLHEKPIKVSRQLYTEVMETTSNGRTPYEVTATENDSLLISACP